MRVDVPICFEKEDLTWHLMNSKFSLDLYWNFLEIILAPYLSTSFKFGQFSIFYCLEQLQNNATLRYTLRSVNGVAEGITQESPMGDS